MLQDDGSSSVTSSSPLQVFPMMSASPSFGSSNPWLKELKSEERGLYLIHLLLACANHVASGSLENANIALDHISQLASPSGDTMQRIASYFNEALADRILRSWPGLYKALRSTKLSVVSEEILVRKMFFEIFPFLKVAFVVSNQAIIEAMEGEKMVHIVDLNAAEPLQWRALLQDLSARPEGPPHLRITGVHQQKEVLDQMAHVLIQEAEKLDIPFQFNQVVSKLENLDVERLRVKTGEALAISSVMQLHTLLAHENEKKSPLPFKHSNGVGLHRALVNQKTLGEFLEKDIANCCSPSILGPPFRFSTSTNFFRSTPTKQRLAMGDPNAERTFIMIKPDGVQRGLVGKIIKRFETKGFKLVAMKFLWPSEELLKNHYADLSSKAFFPGLIKYMASGPVVPMVWEGLDAVKTGRFILGATDPKNSNPGTIRGDLCIQVGRNIIHGSDAVESANKEIALWFSEKEVVPWTKDIDSWVYE